MDTSLDTSSKNTSKNPLFPRTLRGKKLKKNPSLPDADYETFLEKYLQTGNLEYLYNAFQLENCLSLVEEIDLDQEVYITKQPSPEYLDSYTIVGESLRHLKDIVLYGMGGEETIAEAKKYLTKLVGSASIPLWPDTYYYDDMGLVHVCPNKKGWNAKLSYDENFIKCWNSVEQVIKKSKVKKRYTYDEQALLIAHLTEGIKKHQFKVYPRQNDGKVSEILVNFEIYEDEVARFNLKSTRLITASFVALRHSIICPECKRTRKKHIHPDTVEKLYREAKNLLQPISNKHNST